MTDHILIRKIRELAYQYPERVNPRDADGSCVYQIHDETVDGNVSRCIVGEAFHQLGWVVPHQNVIADVVDLWEGNPAFQRLFDAEVAQDAAVLQGQADRNDWSAAQRFDR